MRANIPQADAVSYDMNWKVPCILYYVRKGFSQGAEVKPKTAQPMAVFEQRLLKDKSLAKMQQFAPNPFSGTGAKIDPNHIPGEGDLVAIDAEFVR